MQRVVRYTLAAFVACAALTGCGDKITEVTTTNTGTGTGQGTSTIVTVTPASANLNVGDQITLVATVTPGTGVTDRTVTWASSNAAIASVDANSGVVKALAAGSATITATSKGDPNSKAAALITIGGGQGVANPTVTVSTINQTNAQGNSVPANLGNVAGQIDVTLNVDPGSSKLSEVDLVLNCGAGDVVVAKQTLAASAIAAEAAASPITLSFNTASFDSTGKALFQNGACQLKGKAITSSGTTTSTSTPITLNNQDVLVGSISSQKTAINPTTGLAWVGGNQTVTVLPVFYTPGRSATTVNVTLTGTAGNGTAFTSTQQVAATAGTPTTVTFVDGFDAKGPSNTDIAGVTDSVTTVTATVIDNSGQAFDNTAVVGSQALATQAGVLARTFATIKPIRLDTQKPLAGSLALANNVFQNTSGLGFLGTSFRFAADSAAGFVGPNATAAKPTQNLDARSGTPGVDNVTVQFLVAPNASGTLGTPAAATTTTALGESTTNTGFAIMEITTDALGNADTSFVNGTDITSALKFTATNAAANGSAFGVDLTPPTITGAKTNPANQATSAFINGTGSFTYTISDNLSGPSQSPLIAQVSQNPAVKSSSSAAAGCVIGTFTTTAPAASAHALTVFSPSGSTLGFCVPVATNTAAGTTPLSANQAGVAGYVTTEYIAIDEAGNQAAPITTTVLEDNVAPVVSALDLPGSLTGNSTVSFPASATDNLDLTASVAAINYASSNTSLQYPQTAGPGVPFDNVLTTSASIAPVVTNLITNLQQPGTVSNTTAAGDNATSVTVAAFDPAGNVGFLTGTFAPTIALPATGATVFTGMTGFTASVNNTSVSDCPAAGCSGGKAANPTTTTVTIQAIGPTNTFTNPFAAVQVWYQVNGTGPFFLAGTATPTGSTDNGVNRFWGYTFTWTPPATSPATTAAPGFSLTSGMPINLRAIGLDGAGNAVQTGNVAVALTNP